MTRAAAHHHSKPAAPAVVKNGPWSGLHHDYAARLARIAEQSGCDESEVREVYEERASIRQYLNHSMRDEAEERALDDTEAMLLRRVKP